MPPPRAWSCTAPGARITSLSLFADLPAFRVELEAAVRKIMQD
jgi:hypothetical protein